MTNGNSLISNVKNNDTLCAGSDGTNATKCYKVAKVPYICMRINSNNEMNKDTAILFKEHFNEATTIALDEIRAYFRRIDPDITDTNIRKVVYRLKEKGVIISLKRGVYKLVDKPLFVYDIDNYIRKIHKIFVTKFSGISYCIWSSQWLHQFMNLQPFNHFYIIESEKDILDDLFYLLKDNNTNAFLKPDKDLSERYMLESDKSIAVKLLPSRSPTVEEEEIEVPSIEKMLIDTYCDSDIFFFYQGNELRNIFNNAFRNFHIDYSKLLNYADRRKQKNKIIQYLKSNIEYANKELI